MDIEEYDAIVVGSGQAGNPLALKLAGEGWKVAIREKGQLGGTCVNDGCTPTKTYIASAKKMYDHVHGDRWGVTSTSKPIFDLKSVKARKNSLVLKSIQQIEEDFQNYENLTLIKGQARFIEPYILKVNEQVLKAPKVFLNVGARSKIPPGFENIKYHTHKEMLELETIPQHLIIIGGSYIGLEFAQMFRRFGSVVTVIEKQARILEKEDEDISFEIQQILEKEGISFFLNADCIEAQPKGEGIVVSVACGQDQLQIDGSHVLLAVGRIPNSDLLELENSGIKTDDRGYIKVDQFLETNVKGIYALGDCNGEGAFTHTAYHDYQIVSANLFEKSKKKLDDRILTYGMFIDPPFARAGKNKKEAKAEQLKLKEGYLPMCKVARAKEMAETEGFMRILVNADTDKIIGATLFGLGADEVISSILNVMYADLTVDLILNAVYPHPTVSELLPSVLKNLKPLD
jgi:pyruvate/2-oxoglutarate dehydrogenase complex dihydrolipoamide dehydrogenase (E3) component